MATITGKKIANTYKDLLMVNTGSTYSGLTTSLQQLQDGDGTQAPMQMSSDTVNFTNIFQIGGVTLTASVSALNANADITGVTGIVAMSGGTASGRTITAGAGVSIGNGDGTSGNPTIAINTTGITSASYGPFMQAEFNEIGQAVSIGIPAAASIATFGVETLNVADVHASGDVSVTGTSHFVGAITMDGLTSMTDVALVSLQATKINAVDISVTNLFAESLTVEGYDTSLTDFTSNTLQTVTHASIQAANIVGILSASSGTFSATVSVDTLAATTAITIAGSAVALSSDVEAVSATMATSIANVSGAMTVRADAVSVLTQTNLDAITSVNTVIGTVSGALATSIGNSNSAIAAVSATMATSIGNSNTLIAATSLALATSIGTTNTRIAATSLALATSIGTVEAHTAAVSVLSKTNLDAVTSINVVIGTVSSALATSIGNSNSAITAVSATMATSIGTTNTRVAATSLALATSIANVSSTMATSIANHLPLAGGTLTGALVATSVSQTNIHVTKNTIVDIVSLTDAVSVSISFDQGSNFAITLEGNRTLSTPTNCVGGSGGSIFIKQDGTGSRTLSFAPEWTFAGGTVPTLSTTASAVDRIDYLVRTSTDVNAVASLDVKAGA